MCTPLQNSFLCYNYIVTHTIEKVKVVKKMHSIVVALIFNAADLVTGILSAIKEKNLQSSKLRDGIFKKGGFIICYFLALMIDMYGSEVGFNLTVELLPIVLGFVCLTEVVSIIENISKMTDILPDKLLSLFHFSQKGENDD